MTQPDLFPRPPERRLTDDELAAAITAAMAPGIRHCREADLYLATLCARRVADRLLSAGLRVIEVR